VVLFLKMFQKAILDMGRVNRCSSSKTFTLFIFFSRGNSTVAKMISEDMADVLKSLYRRYLEVSEATFQALLKNHSAGEVHH